MAVELAKVMTALTAKLAGKNVAQKLKEGYAKRWADKISTEDDIEAYLDDRIDDIVDAQKEADRRAVLAAENARKEGKKPEETKQDDAPTDDLPPDTPAWAKALIQQNKTLTEKVNGFEQARTSETLQQRFEKDERLKGIDKVLLHGRYPTREEDFESAVEATTAALKPIIEKLGTPLVGNETPAGGKPQGGSAIKEASKEQLDAVMANMPV